MDYQANSHKSKEPQTAVVKTKTVERVVAGEVVTKKKPLGRKFKDLFINADVKSVVLYVCSDVILPAARNMIVDASTKGIERMMYGENAAQRRRMYGGQQTRYSYNTPVNRGGFSYQNALQSRGVAQTPRQSRDDIVLGSREEAELVLERMQDLINDYEAVSVSDFNELLGLPSSHVDEKWGWLHLRGASVRQVREGFLLDIPSAEPI